MTRRRRVRTGADRPSSEWGRIDDADVIGTASARLLSTCSDRSERLAALSLLGLLLDHADIAGRVRLPLDVLAGELGADAERAVRLLQRLVAIEAVHADGDAVVVAASRPDDGEALRASKFLTNLATVLEGEPGESVPGRVRAASRGTAAEGLHPPRSKPRILVALGVAVAAMALATSPSGEVLTPVQTVAAPTVLDGGVPPTVPPAPDEPPAAPAPPVASTEGTGSAPSEAPPTGDVPPAGPGGPGPPVQEPTPVPPPSDSGSPPREPAQRDATPALPSASVPTEVPRSTPDRPVPSPVPDGAGPATEAPEGAPSCPAGGPEARVSDVRVVGLGPTSVLDLTGERTLAVSGTVRNAAAVALTIAGIEVGIGEGASRVVGSARPVPVTLPPGGATSWEATLVSVAAPLQADTPVLGVDWSWTDLGLAASCPS